MSRGPFGPLFLSRLRWRPGYDSSMKRVGAVLLIVLASACGGSQLSSGVVNRKVGRTLALWVRSDFKRDDAERLRNVGFNQIVVYRGMIDISVGAPVLRLVTGPDLGPGFIQTPVLGLKMGGRQPKAQDAELVWGALKGAWGSNSAGIILDIREAPEGLGNFCKKLKEVSGVPVVPLLSLDQLSQKEARRVAIEAGEIVLPLYGSAGPGFRSSPRRRTLSLRKALEPIAASKVRVRVGIGLEPLMDPEFNSWGGDPDLLINGLAELVEPKHLDRAFVFRDVCSWGGRKWARGDRLEARWMDASRLARAFRESDRLILPEVSGWDLFGFPPQGKVMGLSRQALLAFMVGRGPNPEISVVPERRGKSMIIRVINQSPFASAVSRQGHWLEVSIPKGSLVVRSRGSFDAVVLGSRRSGKWTPGMSDGVDAVRFFEDYIGPGEELKTGTILLPSTHTQVQTDLRFLLSDGHEIHRRTPS